MPVALRSTSTAVDQAAATFSVTKPAGAADGDLLVAFQMTSLGGGSVPGTPEVSRGKRPPPMGGWNKGIRKTHCKNGHEYSPENTRVYNRKDRGQVLQICKTCERSIFARYLARKAGV